MPIPIILQPPPAFDRSIVPAFQTNFNRIRDALLKAFGGDFQSGVAVGTFAANTRIVPTVTFAVPFNQSTGPAVLLTPIDNLTLPGLTTAVIRATPTDFIFIADSTGGAISGNATFRWVAWYP